MSEKKAEYMNKLVEIDDIVKDGVYCIEPSEEDLKAFAEHARKRREAKNKK